jgi:hypothetical protein
MFVAYGFPCIDFAYGGTIVGLIIAHPFEILVKFGSF